MVNNSTNINKTNNHLSPQLTEPKKKTTTNGIGNQGPWFWTGTKMWHGQTYKWNPNLPDLNNWICNGNANDKKNDTDWLPLKKITYYHKNEWKHDVMEQGKFVQVHNQITDS